MTIYVVSAAMSFKSTGETHPLIPRAARTRADAEDRLRRSIAYELDMQLGRAATPDDIQAALDAGQNDVDDHEAMYTDGNVRITWEIDQVEVEESEE